MDNIVIIIKWATTNGLCIPYEYWSDICLEHQLTRKDPKHTLYIYLCRDFY